jgi:hypothetical protein
MEPDFCHSAPTCLRAGPARAGSQGRPSAPWRLAVACALTLLAGCAGAEDPGPPEVGPTSTTPGSLPTPGSAPTILADEAGSAGIDPLTGASTATITAAATNRETALLRAVRVARHEGYDRVVFEFANVLPGYRVGYVQRPVRADGSGEEVTVDGAHVMEAVFENALDADLSRESAPRTYTGPDRLRPATPEVVELVRVGGFEGLLTWVIGVRDRVDFRITTLSSPPRVVIDLRNH